MELFRGAFGSGFYVPEPTARGAVGQWLSVGVLVLEALDKIEEVRAVGVREGECDD